MTGSIKHSSAGWSIIVCFVAWRAFEMKKVIWVCVLLHGRRVGNLVEGKFSARHSSCKLIIVGMMTLKMHLKTYL